MFLAARRGGGQAGGASGRRRPTVRPPRRGRSTRGPRSTTGCRGRSRPADPPDQVRRDQLQGPISPRSPPSSRACSPLGPSLGGADERCRQAKFGDDTKAYERAFGRIVRSLMNCSNSNSRSSRRRREGEDPRRSRRGPERGRPLRAVITDDSTERRPPRRAAFFVLVADIARPPSISSGRRSLPCPA